MGVGIWLVGEVCVSDKGLVDACVCVCVCVCIREKVDGWVGVRLRANVCTRALVVRWLTVCV